MDAASGKTGPKAILFDLQGTCTDFFTSVRGAVGAIDGGRHPGTDWGYFVADWRTSSMRALGNQPRDTDEPGPAPPAWRSVRGVYRDALDELLSLRGMDYDNEHDRVALTLAWETQQPWPDTVPGLERLGRGRMTGVLTNADVTAAVTIVKTGGLPFDVLFSAQMFQAFKPEPAVYLGAADWLSLRPEEVMLVACHHYDLRAARRLGLQTAFVPRPLEFGPCGDPALAFDPDCAIHAKDFLELADQLGL